MDESVVVQKTSYATDTVQAAINLANQEFIKGFLAGQLIFALLLFLLLKLFLFRGRAETRIELIYRELHRYPVKVRQFATIIRCIMALMLPCTIILDPCS